MNVLVLIDAWFPFVGGAQIQIRNLEKLLKLKYGVKYFILHSPSSNILIRFLWSFWVIPQAILISRKEKFDLIHAHAYWSGIPGKVLSLFLRIPVIFTVHGSHLIDLKQKGLGIFWERLILTKIKYNQVISVTSNFLKYKNVNKNIRVIANGVRIKDFDKIKVKKAKPFKLLFVGRDHPHKGLKYLKKSMLEIKKLIPEAKLRIINKGFKKEELIKEYKSSSVFILPSLVEGQPLVLLEAWAARLPVVVTKVGENPKMVKNGVNGYLVKPGDIKSLTKSILKILKDKNRDKMGEKGYQLVKEKYTWVKCAQETYEVYKKTVAEKQPF